MSAPITGKSSLSARIHSFAGTWSLITPTDLNADRKLYGVPARPEQVPLRQAWDCTFSRELRFIEYSSVATRSPEQKSSRDIGPRGDCAPPGRQPALAGAPVARSHETSENWSGAYLLPTSGKRFVQVWGTWRVPFPRPPDGKDPAKEYQCSTWIGLDGQRRYENSTLPQIGTLQTVNSDMPPATAWVQWWQRDDPESTPITLWDFPVAPGDYVTCVITILTKADWPDQDYDQSVLFNIVNRTQHHAMAIRIDPPPIEKRSNRRIWIPGATVAWVMERPAILKTKTLQELANYGSTKFVGCAAAEAAETSPDERMPRDMTNGWPIRMYEVREEPNRIGFISMPTSFENTSFEVRYGSQP
jgi:hypothetical protein